MNDPFIYWRFIAENHPKYWSDDRVLMADIIFRYLDGDTICEDDIAWIEGFGTRREITKFLIKLETELFTEALGSFYEKHFEN